MSIIKIEISIPEALNALKRFKENRIKALEELSQEVKQSVSDLINELLNTEMTLYLGNPEQSENKRNGYTEKSYTLKGIGTLTLKIPQARLPGFESVIIPKSERIDPRLKEDMALLSLAGLSTRTLSLISKRLLGIEVSKDTISSSLELVSERAGHWLRRALDQEYWALYVDGTNFNIQRRGSTEKEPSLVVVGLDKEGHKSILAIEPGYKDDAQSWKTLFKELKSRGLNGLSVQLGIMDGLPGLERVFKEEFPKAVTQRCWVHSLKNALNKCPKRVREAFKILARPVMYADDGAAARRAFSDLKTAMQSDAKRAVECLEKDLDSLLTHYSFEKRFWRALKTTNAIERVNKELKRRTRSMESLGEDRLEATVAFTALKLEMNWRGMPVDDKRLENLMHETSNPVEKIMRQISRVSAEEEQTTE